MNSNNRNSGGYSGAISFSGLLTIAFIVLKLCKVITWKWVWVLAPLWIPVSLWVFALIIILTVLFIKDRRENK